jgi:diaminopimelate epimerase
MVVHNADGSVPEMCGNGLRCAVKFLLERLPEKPTSLNVETGAGVLSCVPFWGAKGVEEVEIAMGPARLVAPHLPSGATGTPFLGQPLPSMPTLVGSAVSMGNPHLVLFDVPLEKAPELGPLLEHATGFSERTNVEFVQKTDEGLKVVVWERGVGLTLACGTGACAAVAVATCLGHLAPEQWVSVRLPGGALSIWVQGDLSKVRLRGPVTYVFSGTCPLSSSVQESP